MSGSRSFELTLALAVSLICAMSLVATGIVIFSDIPPVVNRSIGQYRALNAVIFVTLGGVLAVLLLSVVSDRFLGVRRAILLGFTVFLTMEGLFYLFDTQILSVKDSPVATAFRNIEAAGEVIYLPQPNALSPFGFRTPREEAPDYGGYRILFLGNSYVQGSGSSFAVNYPQAVEAALRKAMPGRDVSVFSAGVDGFGIKEDLVLYQYLLDHHYRFDAVVLNFMLGSDPTNDIPGTIREAIAGQPQRLHEGWFLRYFYPFNTYVSRYLVYLDVTFNQKWGAAPGAPGKAPTTCQQTATFTNFSHDRAADYYGPGAPHRLFMDFNLEKLSRLADVAARNKAKLFLVLLPDPNALLAGNRAYFAGKEMKWTWTRELIAARVAGKMPLLDLSPVFLDRPDMFRCNDTHWNDTGNVVGAQHVADFLAPRIGAE